MNEYTSYYKQLHTSYSIPKPHIEYLKTIGYTPNVVYDIGAAVLHWTKEAKQIWPNTQYIAFEAMTQVEDFYREHGVEYAIGVFSDIDDKEVTFHCHPQYLGGNSYYKENEVYSPAAKNIYTPNYEERRKTITIDSVTKLKKYPLPDLVKIDVQGAEIDILRGMTNTLKNVKHLIVELQHVQYNLGAQLIDTSIPFITSLGFELIPCGRNDYFCGNGPDADYHFIRK